MPEDLKQRLRERLPARIRDFDMPALLELLQRAGYGAGDIEFRSLRTNVHQGRLVDSIEFRDPPKPVIITVNVGLLSVQSLLPSFMLRALEQEHDERMERFLGYFDHLLLQQRFASLFPEREERLLPGWHQPDKTKTRLHMLRPTCPSTLHWLFSRVFPEMQVLVRRELRRQAVPTTHIRLGTTLLGDSAAMGGFARVPTGGMEVFLYCDEPFSSSGRPWAEEAPRRLETQVLSLLAGMTLLLTVVLVLRDVNDYARAEDDSFMGYAPIKGGPESAQRIVLFSGDTARYTPPQPHPLAPAVVGLNF
jgi:hypothetical protein